MPKLDLSLIPVRSGSDYPAPFAERLAGRTRQALGDAGGLTDFGVNLTKLPPGAWSSQRHWHSEEDEFVYVISGELTLITDDGEQLLQAGDCAAFPKNTPNGHHMVNRGSGMAICLDIGSRSARDVCISRTLTRVPIGTITRIRTDSPTFALTDRHNLNNSAPCFRYTYDIS